ncbi:MAG: lysine--tRNA ligase [Phycisphaerales bacterium]
MATTPTTTESGSDAGSSTHRLEQQRRENRDAVRALGMNPYGQRTDGLITLAEAKARYDEAADQKFQDAEQTNADARKADPNAPQIEIVDGRPIVKVAGRVMLKRGQGKLVWLQIRDHTTGPAVMIEGQEADDDAGKPAIEPSPFRGAMASDLQIAASKKDVNESSFELVKQLDLGDIVVVEGRLGRTRKGEITVWANNVKMASKSIVPPPEKWSGLQDIEQRYRKRYVDLYTNPEAMQAFKLRSRMMSRMREYLGNQDFLEVDTPVLQAMAGGAAARPFRTHMNALDIDLFMRIAPELYLKRLMVGGMPRVYEFSRNFRNEGVDKSHNPEFTSLELYQAFGNYETMAEIAEGLIRDAASFVASELGDRDDTASGDLVLPYLDHQIDYGRPFDRITYAELFENALGFPMTDTAKARAEAEKRGLKTKTEDGTQLADILIVNELFEEVAEPTIDPARPTFVFDYPAALSPLTRPDPENPELAQRWDLFIGGMEIGPAYTELNDPDIQEAKFREQLAGIDDEETTFRTFDEDFVNALKVGMPPAGGLGLGIDRLCMLLMNQRTIRDVILFPMMRPEA